MFFVARASLSAKNHLSNDLSHFHLYFFCKISIYLKPTLYQTQSMLATFFSIYFLNFYTYMMFQFFHGWISSGNKRIKVMVARTGGGLIIALLLWKSMGIFLSSLLYIQRQCAALWSLSSRLKQNPKEYCRCNFTYNNQSLFMLCILGIHDRNIVGFSCFKRWGRQQTQKHTN
jgi:hypothetical protein